MSFLLVFLAIVLVGAVLWATLGQRGRSAAPGSALGRLEEGFGQPVANLPPVLLPEAAVPADVDRIRFGLGLRGYRMDQVDQVLDDLRDQLATRDLELASLRAELAGSQAASVTQTVGTPAGTQATDAPPQKAT
ncbi:hypothetical protein PSET11_01885 [Arthrobacter ulcerisalmonis]|uniref:DivIVA domain-containing protein n=1 Tax=Arthrobacter ulcerisalmonis TaxID=2483813 RepID=A0A3P5XEM0_9MICC|nr:DivIVA domain-containing protein [Arthrobacter ulcerisalmonis]VDC26981.1 hypothetical protein PSET11_01885 [Arthrobacter ulcerisalmonis]